MLTSSVYAGGAFVDEAISLGVREVESLDVLAHGDVEELQPGADEPLHASPVEAREARELVLVCEVERRDEEREDLGVLDPNAVVRGRGQPELAAQAPEQLGRPVETRPELFVRLEPGGGLRQEQAHRERELAARDALRDRLQRDPGRLERAHQADDVDVGGRKEAFLVGGDEPELLQALDVVGGARDELGQLSCG